jgi:hypothetical protein
MDNDDRPGSLSAQSGCVLAPIHISDHSAPLTICVLVRAQPDAAQGSFVLLRELPGSSVYLGGVCDKSGRIVQWVEVWVQTLDFKDLELINSREQASNDFFDKRWISECQMFAINLPHEVLATGMEDHNPSPLLINPHATQPGSGCVPSEITQWRICKDDALLQSQGLPPYSTSPFRYLYEPEAPGTKTFLATTDQAPSNSHVQGIDRLASPADGIAVFNPQAGLLRVTRFYPLELEDYLQILEGRRWLGEATNSWTTRLFPNSIYAELEAWSARPKGLPFLLHGGGTPLERLNEIFFLKLSALRDIFKEVRACVKAQQLPLLNVFPASFRVCLQQVGDQFPALWAAKSLLVKPGQAYPLKIKSTEQRYFLRLGAVEPSPFLPEMLGAHFAGVGKVNITTVTTETDGVVVQGTLVAEDYLGVDPHDLLWFKLPVGNDRLEFYAHVYTAEARGPKEARFRTVPARLSDSVTASLKRVAGTVFPRSPFEIWPLLSSPCDLYSLGVLASRALLANANSNLPVILDNVLSLSRLLCAEPADGLPIASRLRALIQQDQRLCDLVSPHALVESADTPAQSRAKIHWDLWLETVALILRLFPGSGPRSFCKDFGDVSPLALETVFDAPIQEFETLLLRLRSILAPSFSANEEIASVILEQLGPD